MRRAFVRVLSAAAATLTALVAVLLLAGASARVPTAPVPTAQRALTGTAAPARSTALTTTTTAPATAGPTPSAPAAPAVALPGGGRVLFPGRRMVALYGSPGAASLGVLGEQDVAASVRRAEALAAQYQPLVAEPVVPAFELIATVADAVPGADGDYSAELSVERIRPWVDAAAAAGMYVVLDLQPGRADFLSQSKRYADLLALPNVGLALDAEWRLGPTQLPRQQIGSVGIAEVNAVVAWLAELTREHGLPQKLLMLHQFRTSMIVGRQHLDTSHPELSLVIHCDGFGTPDLKLATWAALHTGAPATVRWGWKNFYDEDSPTYTPAQTVAVGPTSPVFVSYQ